MNWPSPATTIHGSAAAAASTAASGPNPVRSSAIGRAAITVAARSGTATMPTASAYDAVSDESRPASRALASDGRTVTRTAVAASARTMNTPYAAKKPSVSAVRPSFRAMTTPTTAASPVCTAIPTAVTAPVASEPSPVRVVGFRTDAKPTARALRLPARVV